MSPQLLVYLRPDIAPRKLDGAPPTLSHSRLLARGLGRPQHLLHCRRVASPCRRLTPQVLAPSGSETVELGSTVVLGNAPLGRDQFALLQAVQCRIERPLLHPERIVGELLNPSGDAVSVHRPPREGLQHQQIQRTLQQIGRSSGQTIAPIECQWEGRVLP